MLWMFKYKTMKKNQLVRFCIILGVLAYTFTSCSREGDLTATINTNEPNNISGDVSGNGGSVTKTWTFENTNVRAGWDMSIDASAGSFRLVLEDVEGTSVVDQTLTAGSGPQSADGTSEDGVAGTWTATLTLTGLKGSGDYSFR